MSDNTVLLNTTEMTNLKKYKIYPHNLQFSEYLNKTCLTLWMNYKATLQFSDDETGQNFISYIWPHMVLSKNNPYIRNDILHNINKHIIILKTGCKKFYSGTYKTAYVKCTLLWLLYLFSKWTMVMIREWPSNQPHQQAKERNSTLCTREEK